ncbi:MAG: NADH:flavin oxidoreductase/NADH oxidase family protein [Desulfobacterales bacterium]
MTAKPRDILKTPLILPCGARLANRLAKSAMSENLAGVDHSPTPLHVRLYEKWANGGIGLCITGNIMVDAAALGEPRNVVVEDETFLDPLRNWAAAGTTNKTHLWAQLNHPGKQSPKALSEEPVAPSAIGFSGALQKFFNPPRALSEEEIKDLIQRFANTAKIVKKAGFTGVEIHGAHGYLVSQFLSPKHNQRTDDWGGTPENRMRFVLEVYRAIRKAVGKKFPIGIKLNSSDFMHGGFTEEESIAVAKALADDGIDLIEISGGTYERPAMAGLPENKRHPTRKPILLRMRKKSGIRSKHR